MEATIENLKRNLARTLPKSEVETDPPGRPNGNWWIDVILGKKRVTLQYHPDRGFGIFHDDAGYGEAPSEFYAFPNLAAKRVAELITSMANSPSIEQLRHAVSLKERITALENELTSVFNGHTPSLTSAEAVPPRRGRPAGNRQAGADALHDNGRRFGSVPT